MAASAMPRAANRSARVSGMNGRGQNVVPPPESDKHFVGQADETLGHGRVFLHEVKRDALHHRADVLDSQVTVASHHCGIGEHVSVMGGVDNKQILRRPEDRAVAIVRSDGPQVFVNGSLPTAAANIDV